MMVWANLPSPKLAPVQEENRSRSRCLFLFGLSPTATKETMKDLTMAVCVVNDHFRSWWLSSLSSALQVAKSVKMRYLFALLCKTQCNLDIWKHACACKVKMQYILLKVLSLTSIEIDEHFHHQVPWNASCPAIAPLQNNKLWCTFYVFHSSMRTKEHSWLLWLWPTRFFHADIEKVQENPEFAKWLLKSFSNSLKM